MEVYLTDEDFTYLVYNGKLHIQDVDNGIVTIHNGHTNKKCWNCGRKGKMTRHHVLNKAWHPHINLIIPLCKKCHKQIHKRTPDRIDKYEQYIKKPRNTSKVTLENVHGLKLSCSVRIDKPDGSFRTYCYYNLPKYIKTENEYMEDKRNKSNWVRFK